MVLTLTSCEDKNQDLIDKYFFASETNTGSNQPSIKVGDSYQGGKLAYIFQSGDNGFTDGTVHGIIAANSDLSTTYTWYNGTNLTTNATLTFIGSASDNSYQIYEQQGTGNYAASMCLSYESGGYSDWFLPTINELQILYNNRTVIGGFIPYSYWSSTEVANNTANGIHFGTGTTYGYNKNGKASIRPIRYF
ncbi:MAG: DUF1566 domain-containing protein [Paludibacter sp.]